MALSSNGIGQMPFEHPIAGSNPRRVISQWLKQRLLREKLVGSNPTTPAHGGVA
jgi:hypothetical protein